MDLCLRPLLLVDLLVPTAPVWKNLNLTDHPLCTYLLFVGSPMRTFMPGAAHGTSACAPNTLRSGFFCLRMSPLAPPLSPCCCPLCLSLSLPWLSVYRLFPHTLVAFCALPLPYASPRSARSALTCMQAAQGAAVTAVSRRLAVVAAARAALPCARSHPACLTPSMAGGGSWGAAAGGVAGPAAGGRRRRWMARGMS